MEMTKNLSMEMTIYDTLLEKFKADDDQLHFEAKQSFSLETLPGISFFKTLIESVPERDKIIINLINKPLFFDKIAILTTEIILK